MPISMIAPLIPEIFLACAAMLLLLAGVFRRRSSAPFMFKVAFVILLAIAWEIAGFQGTERVTAMNGLFVSDGFSGFVKIIILIASALVMVIANYVYTVRNPVCYEFPVLMLFSVVGMMAMVSANDLLSLYMALELQSLSLYLLASIDRESERSAEAGLKYFMLGALASGILLFGCSIVYGMTGTTSFSALAQSYVDISTLPAAQALGMLTGLVLVLIGLFFKISAVPFHMWTPDVYEGAPRAVTAFFATAPKVAAMAVLARFLMQPSGPWIHHWQQIIALAAIASMAVGSFAALRQENLKRLLAYSSIGHAGFMLVGLVSGTDNGVQAVLVYLAVYAAMTAGAFACLAVMRRQGVAVYGISDLAGLSSSHPVFAALIAVLMFSMAGVPPMAGFLGKFFVFQAALEAGFHGLAIIGVLISVVAAFYYLKIVKVMYFDTLKDRLDSGLTVPMRLLLLGTGLFNLLLFVHPAPLLNAARTAAGTLFQ